MMTMNASQVIADLQLIVHRMQDMAPVLSVIGERQRDAIETRIMTGKTDPDGERWAPWRPWRAAEREAKGNASQGLLWDTGDLLHSIIDSADQDSVAIGTAVSYADELQYGRRNMAPRPFIGWGREDEKEVDRLAVTYIMAGAL